MSVVMPGAPNLWSTERLDYSINSNQGEGHEDSRPRKAGGLVRGDDRDRTDYLFNAIEALYQLSYIPVIIIKIFSSRIL